MRRMLLKRLDRCLFLLLRDVYIMYKVLVLVVRRIARRVLEKAVYIVYSTMYRHLLQMYRYSTWFNYFRDLSIKPTGLDAPDCPDKQLYPIAQYQPAPYSTKLSP